jgi:hypothetical protein
MRWFVHRHPQRLYFRSLGGRAIVGLARQDVRDLFKGLRPGIAGHGGRAIRLSCQRARNG